MVGLWPAMAFPRDAGSVGPAFHDQDLAEDRIHPVLLDPCGDGVALLFGN